MSAVRSSSNTWTEGTARDGLALSLPPWGLQEVYAHDRQPDRVQRAPGCFACSFHRRIYRRFTPAPAAQRPTPRWIEQMLATLLDESLVQFRGVVVFCPQIRAMMGPHYNAWRLELLNPDDAFG